jgi:hypothetical protein
MVRAVKRTREQEETTAKSVRKAYLVVILHVLNPHLGVFSVR